MKGSRNSLVSLRVFVAASGHLNFSRTAEDLHMTQSAVSKHIQSLELKLGASLFKRTPTGLQLTYAGAIYLENISAALRLIDEADAKVAHPSARVNLNIAVSPSFAQHCLFPHFQEFFDRHPEIRINVRPRLMSPRDRSERFDAEIQLHTGHRSGMSCDYLCGREMCLVAAPMLLARSPLAGIEDLDALPLLKRAQRGYGWDEWKAEMAPDWPGPGRNAPEYEGFSMLLPALMHGLGAAIVPLCIVQPALREGSLVRPFGEAVPGRYGYYLMQPRPLQGGPYLDAFTGWVSELAAALDAPP
ncbi:LysR substrate-binding domain-containing protein [Xylophilus sp. GOD-11R]|uniref:LysR substrate-binding domain-containing protein n=1 Tax=Xylophilus sp. GOD-11R TaxID=3089814 RepID=UPI00298C2D15|nr:LysR substrate-binding domain-containing protein [Xylophilus sp. GOD-11R]WPB55727.1 LysR substrate-binding domain-containing protein [Xylophilus sp. GOD-11R]